MPNTSVVIREARLSDLPGLQVMEQGLIHDERPFDPTIREEPVQYYDLRGLIRDPDCLLLVAESNNRLVSCGYARKRIPRPYLDHKSYAYLGFMYTHPEFRGRGLNGQIMASLRQWCVKRGWNELRLTVYTQNASAIRAYEKAGFSSHLLEMRLRPC